MQRHEMIDAMRGLGLKGMAGAFDEAVSTGVQRQRTAMEILSDLLRAEGAHRHAASIRYRMTAARLPVVKDLDAFVFENTPINEGLPTPQAARTVCPASTPASATKGSLLHADRGSRFNAYLQATASSHSPSPAGTGLSRPTVCGRCRPPSRV